jgi:methionyl-tRNA formyltransferase
MKVWALCTVASGLDVLDTADVKLAGIIGLSKREYSDTISGYADMEGAARERGVPFLPVESYTLSDPADRARLEAQDIDLLLVVGWQRLTPSWLIDHVRVGVIGVHGSAGGISAGRGRSPQNWAIMLGAESFSVSLFVITPGIDEGPVLATSRYPLTPHDDISDSYRKLSLLTGSMIANVLRDDPLLLRRDPQPAEAFYLPQRLPEDGAIDFNRPACKVDAFVRALARPYPGAYCQIGEARLRFWRSAPWAIQGLPNAPPGTIVRRFQDGSLLIACAEGHLLVKDWDMQDGDAATIRTGDILPSVNFQDQMRRIVARHRAKHPQLLLSPAILSAAGEE